MKQYIVEIISYQEPFDNDYETFYKDKVLKVDFVGTKKSFFLGTTQKVYADSKGNTYVDPFIYTNKELATRVADRNNQKRNALYDDWAY